MEGDTLVVATIAKGLLILSVEGSKPRISSLIECAQRLILNASFEEQARPTIPPRDLGIADCLSEDVVQICTSKVQIFVCEVKARQSMEGQAPSLECVPVELLATRPGRKLLIKALNRIEEGDICG